MALSANTVWEIRSDGDDTNGGGFVTGSSGTDWSQQASAQYSVTDAVTNGTTTITSATANFGTDVVGNLLYIQGGTGSITASWYQIISRTNATTIVVDRSTGLTTGTGATLKIGGALASIGGLGAIIAVAGGLGISGMKAYQKSGTYTLTSTTANVSGGKLDLNGSGIASKLFILEGYNITRGDLGSKPINDVAALTSFTVINTSGNFQNRQHRIVNIGINGNGNTNIVGFDSTNNGGYVDINSFLLCQADMCTIGFGGTNAMCGRYRCRTISCTTGFVNGFNSFCEAFSGTTGFQSNVTSGNQGVLRCLARSCSGIGFDFGANYNILCISCTSHGNTSDGFKSSTYDMFLFYGNLATNNGGYGFNFISSGKSILSLYNAGYGNTSGNWANQSSHEYGFISLSGNPYIDSINADFRPDNTSEEGNALRSALLGIASQVNNLDIGAIQHSDIPRITRILTGGII